MDSSTGVEWLTLSHDLVDLAVLLAADELLVLIRKFNLHAHLILTPLDEWNLIDDHHRRFHRVIRPIDGECQIVKAYFRARVGADIGQHRTNVGR